MGFELTGRDYIEFALTDINLDAQLMAARSLLRRNREADAQLTEDIRALEERARSASGPFADRLVDDHTDLLFASVFHDAANSMAAVGMVAPMMESTFVALFNVMGYRLTAPPFNLSNTWVGAIFLVYLVGAPVSAWFDICCKRGRTRAKPSR